MSFASSQHLSPTYKNISASGNLNVSGTSNLNTTFINTTGGQTVNGLRVNNTNPASSGSSTNSIQVLQGNYGLSLSGQLTQGVGSSFSLGTGDINDGFDTVMSGDQNTLTIASTNLNANNLALNNGLTFNSNPSSYTTSSITQSYYNLNFLNNCGSTNGNGNITFGFTANDPAVNINTNYTGFNSLAIFNDGIQVNSGTITTPSINCSGAVTTGSSGIILTDPNMSITVNSTNKNMYFTTYEGAGFYFDQDVYVSGAIDSNALTADTMEVGLTTSANPTQPTTSQHIGFVIKESFQNESLVTDVSNGLLTFTLPKGTWSLNGVLQLDIPSSTNFSSAVISQTLGSDVISSFTSTQLVPTNCPNNMNVNLPIFNTIFNSEEQLFVISVLAQYASASNISVTSNSYIIATRIA